MITLETENTFANQYSTNRGKFLCEANAVRISEDIQIYFTSSVLVPWSDNLKHVLFKRVIHAFFN